MLASFHTFREGGEVLLQGTSMFSNRFDQICCIHAALFWQTHSNPAGLRFFSVWQLPSTRLGSGRLKKINILMRPEKVLRNECAGGEDGRFKIWLQKEKIKRRKESCDQKVPREKGMHTHRDSRASQCCSGKCWGLWWKKKEQLVSNSWRWHPTSLPGNTEGWKRKKLCGKTRLSWGVNNGATFSAGYLK